VCIILLIVFYRNSSYHTRVQLAVLDHNFHSNREQARRKSGELMFARKFRKQTKKWDITPTLKKKTYEYIPDLMKDIMTLRVTTSSKLKDKVVLDEHHPKRRQSTIGNTQPLPTTELVSNKKSRFHCIQDQKNFCNVITFITKIVHHPCTLGIPCSGHLEQGTSF